MHRRTRRALGVLAVLAALPATAAHAERSRLLTINVDSRYRMPPGTTDGAGCALAPAPGCTLLIRGTAVVEGTIEATGSWTGVLWPKPDGDLGYVGHNYLSGTIAGCGSGTFIYEDIDGTLFTSQFDPLTQSIPGHNRWVIRPESTTGELAKRLVSAGGDQHWRSYPFNQDAAAENWGSGSITGTVVCRAPRSKLRAGRRESRPGRPRASHRRSSGRRHAP